MKRRVSRPHVEAGAPQQCSKYVYGGLAMSPHLCSRKGTVQRGGKWFCGQHDPEAVAARIAERNAKWEAKWKTRDEIRDRIKAIQSARDAVVEAAREWSAFHSVFHRGKLDAAVDALEQLERLEGKP